MEKKALKKEQGKKEQSKKEQGNKGKAKAKKGVVVDYPLCVVEKDGKKMGVTSVRVSAGYTVPTGDYATARRDLAITVTPLSDEITVSDMVDFATDYITLYLGKMAKRERQE